METDLCETVLLKPIGNAIIPATYGRFIVKDHFYRNPQVKFSAIWDEFKKRFFGKVEDPIAEVTLQSYVLLKAAADAPIITELGGTSRVKNTITALYTLLSQQAKGGRGILQTNGYANIFYVPDKSGFLCAVRVGWDGDGWVIDAIPVGDPMAWNGRHLIFTPAAETNGF